METYEKQMDELLKKYNNLNRLANEMADKILSLETEIIIKDKVIHNHKQEIEHLIDMLKKTT